MSIFERRVLAELVKLRQAESALEGMYKTLRTTGADNGKSFMSSLRNLDERVNRLENLLERAA
jgi:hypothetical protein